MLNQIRELCLLPGVSSFEAPVRSFLRARAEPDADDIRTDAMGNLIVFKKGRKSTGSKLLFYGTKKTLDILRDVHKDNPIEAEFRLFDDWDDFLIITRDMQPDDGLIIVMSHKGLPSFQTGMKKIPNYMAKYFSDYNFILIYPIHTIAEESENRDLLNASLLPNFNKFEGIGKSISKALKAK